MRWFDKKKKKEVEAQVKGDKDSPVPVEVRHGDTPAKVELSGDVNVKLDVEHRGIPEPAEGGGIEAGEALQDSSPGNLFTTFRHQESALDEQRSYKIRCVDQALGGRRTTVADVRRQYGDRLDLGGRHRAYVAGHLVSDDYEPKAGEEVVWKEDAKQRG